MYAADLGALPEGFAMSMTVFKIEPSNTAKLSEITSDDTLSRQSIHTRDATALGLSGNHLYMRIQGSDEAIARAQKIFLERKIGEALPLPEAEKISRAIDAEEEAAAEGMGMIFGG